MAQVGDRVGAMRNANAEKVFLFGYGVYEGEKPCPHLSNIPNPCIKLDDGTVVWGMECWWGPEDKIKQAIRNRAVEIIKPER